MRTNLILSSSQQPGFNEGKFELQLLMGQHLYSVLLDFRKNSEENISKSQVVVQLRFRNNQADWARKGTEKTVLQLVVGRNLAVNNHRGVC